MKIVKPVILVTLAVLLIGISTTSLFSQRLVMNWDRILKEQEKKSEVAITENYQDLEKMYYLSQKKVKNPITGMRLTVSEKSGMVHFLLKGNKYLENYDKDLIGYEKDSITVSFKDGKLSRLERIFVKKEFASETSIVLRIVDNNPLSTDHNNILITRVENGETIVRDEFGKFANTPGSQERTELKSSYADYTKGLLFLLNQIAFETQKAEENRKKSTIGNIPGIISY